MNLHKVKIDTQKRIYEIDGKPIETAIGCTVQIVAVEPPQVTFTVLAEVECDGGANVTLQAEEGKSNGRK